MTPKDTPRSDGMLVSEAEETLVYYRFEGDRTHLGDTPSPLH